MTSNETIGTAGTVSVVIPVLNEAPTVGSLIRFVARSPRVIEVFVIDDGSIDNTADVAAEAGAVVLTSSLLGKGASMTDGVRVASGDVVLFLDGDLRGLTDDVVDRMTDPILHSRADMVKARFTRSAGRVTILTARPLLSCFFPELAGFEQPLAGIAAARRSLLHNLRFENDYGVDVALLIDAVLKGAKVTEVDIGSIDHDSQPLQALGEMATQVTRVILDRAWRYERLSINQVLERQEMERRAQAQLLPAAGARPFAQPYALFDMDGVILDGRYVVALAEKAGVEPALMRLLDNHGLSAKARSNAIAGLFAGVAKADFEEVAHSMLPMPGAVETIVGLRRKGYRVGIVTDSYCIAAEIVRRRVFADFCVAHIMHFRKGVATGNLTLAPAMADANGCAEHEYCKSNVMRHLQHAAGLDPRDTVAVGDGENDICMLRSAGMSVAFRPKTRGVESAAMHRLDGPLTDILRLLDSAQTAPTRSFRPRWGPALNLGGGLSRQTCRH